jgi:hypothetical protein
LRAALSPAAAHAGWPRAVGWAVFISLVAYLLAGMLAGMEDVGLAMPVAALGLAVAGYVRRAGAAEGSAEPVKLEALAA